MVLYHHLLVFPISTTRASLICQQLNRQLTHAKEMNSVDEHRDGKGFDSAFICGSEPKYCNRFLS
ncbi:hypothetical protein T4C_10521 [Trichinella pseudospiralis]|uniref:Uncharacterized protein n=1 Tax=Trichinella pseudospiralis TaxID=6337 RepID=A0A0V1FTV4_TRIPS|nr:hypothetical protein T4D_14134 [Trichinella pseudospiralis]KRZ41835.1 hypothetical protein T4C_10521 [Trichinella pseudospiralis]